MLIRPATGGDQTGLSRIYLTCRIETFHWIDPATFSLHDFINDTAGEAVLAAVENGAVAGFASVWVEDNFLHHLYIDPGYQGRGIGAQLLEHCLATVLKRPARLKCLARNERACRFYERQGWTRESTVPESPAGPYHVYVLR